jgi:transposase-like protein
MAKGQGKVASNKSAIIAALPRACQDEQAAVEFFEAQRWGDTGPCCPKCGDTDVYQMKDRNTGERNKRFLWLCKGCRKQFTVRVGSVYEDSPIQLRHWAYAFWAACASKKGVSALQIKRQTGLTYKSALFMMHRVRFAMADDPKDMPKLTGDIEADETYVGGKPRYPGQHKRGAGSGHAPVVALVERGGRVHSMYMPKVTVKSLQSAVSEIVEPSASRLFTDEKQWWIKPGREFGLGHDTVNHRDREFARGDVTTNTIEGVFSLLKRGIYGTFHSVSRKHLHRYLAEFDFRYNTRRIDDGARTVLAIRNASGKRLFYKEPLVPMAQ